MLKTYITTVPLQGKLDPMLYQRERADTPTATCFPIVQVELTHLIFCNAQLRQLFQQALIIAGGIGIFLPDCQQLHRVPGCMPVSPTAPRASRWSR